MGAIRWRMRWRTKLFGQLVMTLNGIATRPTIFRQPPEKPCWIPLPLWLIALSVPCWMRFASRNNAANWVLRQQFRAQTGMTINQYASPYLPRAVSASQPAVMISEISMQCGFEDSNYFSVVFTRENRMTPSHRRHLSNKAINWPCLNRKTAAIIISRSRGFNTANRTRRISFHLAPDRQPRAHKAICCQKLGACSIQLM